MPVRSRTRPRDPEAPGDASPIETVLSGRALLHGRLQPVDIGISSDGRIARVARMIRGGERRELGDRVILPAATDLHVHFRDPGPPDAAETFESGSVAAALGGVGVVGEMPNTDPPVSNLERFASKRSKATGRLAVDTLLYALPNEPSETAKLARVASGFKLYMAPTTGIGALPDSRSVDEVLRTVASTQLPLTVHAEDPAKFGPVERATDPVRWDTAHPIAAELAAVEHLVAAAPRNLRLNVAHVTSSRVADRLTAAGHAFEATAHHLLTAARRGMGTFWKVNPPLRDEPTRAGLWEEFRLGHVPFLASDHAPHAAVHKELPFPEAPSGVPGVETTLPLMLAEVRAGRLDLGVLVRAACERPARWMGLDLGRLSPGHRANVIVVDFRRRTQLHGARLHSRAGWTPFERREAVFPVEHYRDGEPIVLDGEYVGTRTGRILRPSFAPA